MFLTIFVTVCLGTTVTYSQDLTRCCDEGFSRGMKSYSNDNSCDPDEAILSNLKGFLKTMCASLFKDCCISTTSNKYCQKGVTLAAANHLCLADSGFEGDKQKLCCECCKKGKAHGLIGGSCKKKHGNPMCSSSFENCCQKTKTREAMRDNKVSKATCASVNCKSANRKCVESENGARCKCKNGFLEEAGTCEDINECFSKQYNCRENSYCENTIGSYKCVCGNGFKEVNDKCVAKKSSCTEGYVLKDGVCLDEDECLTGKHQCSRESFCFNTEGTYRCIHNCQYPEYEVVKEGVCQDVDECKRGVARCPENFVCVNLLKSYKCKRVHCEEGYILKNGFCEDKDECELDPMICGEQGYCRNARGRHYCDCQTGYSVDPATGKCADVDECRLDRDHCKYQCINTEGSFRCKCPDGYEMRGRYCYDIDECGSNPCPGDTHCFNTFGSFACINQTCPNKYYTRVSKKPGDLKNCKKVRCEDDNECSKIVLESIKRAASRFFNLLPVGGYMFDYWIEYNTRFYKISFRIISGNEEKYFEIQRNEATKMRLINRKEIKGPKDFHLVLHTDVATTSGTIMWRYEYHFYIYLSAYKFG